MRKYFLFLLTITILASCSTPKYTYYFDHYNYNSGKKRPAVDKAVPDSKKNVDKNPLTLDSRTLTASKDHVVVPLPDKSSLASAESNEIKLSTTSAKVSAATSARRYKELSKAQRKEFRKAMRENMRRYVVPKKSTDPLNSVTSVKEAKVMDHDLKMAIIFGSVGLTLSLFGGVNTVFWVLSVIAVVVGVVFLIKWLSRQ
jgi:hypothetical protein